MKAAVLHNLGGPFVIEDVDLQDPGPGEVKIRMVAAGVCHSDWHMVTGALRRPFPVVLGHEGAGVVDAVGEGVTTVKPGDHIVLNWSPDCGTCFYCTRGNRNLCETFRPARRAGTMLDGTSRLRLNGAPVCQFSTVSTFAEYAVAPEESCIRIRADVPLAVASLLSCAVTTGVGAALNTVDLHPGDSVAVYGCGGVGLNVLQGAALCGAGPIIAVDTVPAKLDIARQFGATHSIQAGPKALDQISGLTGGRGADYVFEAIGLPAVQQEAFAAARPGGTLVVVGVAPIDSTTNFPGFQLHVQEKRILGSLYGSSDTRRDFPLFLDLYKAGKLKLDELISREYRLDQINEAYQILLQGETKRGVIVFE